MELIKELELEEEMDYIVPEKTNSVWITIDNISVHLIRTDEGVVCDMYPLHHETDDTIACTWVTFAEAEAAIAEEEI